MQNIGKPSPAHGSPEPRTGAAHVRPAPLTRRHGRLRHRAHAEPERIWHYPSARRGRSTPSSLDSFVRALAKLLCVSIVCRIPRQMCLAKMCQKRVKKIKNGSTLRRQREARRLMRLRRDPTPPFVIRNDNKQNVDPAVLRASSAQVTYPVFLNLNDPAHAAAQKQVLLELAWRTVALLQRNKLIQEKIIELQKETNEYVASVLQNPAEMHLHLQRMAQYSAFVATPASVSENDEKTVKSEVEN